MTRIFRRVGLLVLSGWTWWGGLGLAQPTAGAETTEPRSTDRPFLWKIEGTPASFLYGTIHLPDPRVLALPEIVTRTLDASDVLYLEVPMDGSSQQEIASAFLLPEGKTLKTILPEGLYRRTDAFCQTKGISLALMDRVSVMGVVAQLQFLDYMDELMAGQVPLDVKLHLMASQQEKPIESLETIKEQLDAFNAFTEEEQLSLLEQTLDLNDKEAANHTTATERLVRAYLDGDEEAIVRLSKEYLDPDEPATRRFVQNLIVDRNARMADRIDAHLKSEPGKVHFFAVGALHFPDTDGILTRLEAKGYHLARLGPGDLDAVPAAVAAPEGN